MRAKNSISLPEAPAALREAGADISYCTLWRAAVEGRLPAVKHRRRWFVRMDDLLDFAANYPA